MMKSPILESTEEQKRILKENFCKNLAEVKIPDSKQVSVDQRVDNITT